MTWKNQLIEIGKPIVKLNYKTMNKIKLIRKQKGVSTKNTIIKIIDPEYNPYGVHPSRLTDWQYKEAIKLLAEQLDTLSAIVAAYKTGKL